MSGGVEKNSRLCIKQIRPTDNRNIVYAMVDGGSSTEMAELVRNKLRHFLQLQVASIKDDEGFLEHGQHRSAAEGHSKDA